MEINNHKNEGQNSILNIKTNIKNSYKNGWCTYLFCCFCCWLGYWLLCDGFCYAPLPGATCGLFLSSTPSSGADGEILELYWVPVGYPWFLPSDYLASRFYTSSWSFFYFWVYAWSFFNFSEVLLEDASAAPAALLLSFLLTFVWLVLSLFRIYFSKDLACAIAFCWFSRASRSWCWC